MLGMKKMTFLCAAILTAGCAHHRNQPRGAAAPQTAADTGSDASSSQGTNILVSRGKDFRVWKRIAPETLPTGRTIQHTNRFVELATGSSYSENGEWKDAREEIVIVPDGAAATQMAHKLHLNSSINTFGAVRVTTPDQKTIRSTVLGLAYTDANGQSVMFAPIRDSSGVLFPPNQVVYENAFGGGIRADVRVSTAKAGVECDVILRSRLPLPQEVNPNLDPDTVMLEIWHEFDAPEPERKARVHRDFADDSISWGLMRLGRGGAFALDAPLSRVSAAPVGKTWFKDPNSGRTFLIERVRYSFIEQETRQLPPMQAAIAPLELNSRVALLDRTAAPRPTRSQPVQMAFDTKAVRNSKGLVLDYQLINQDTNDTVFQADTTYFITDAVNFSGLTVFEGNAVIKFATTNQSILQTWNEVVFKSGPYAPVIFTSQQDRSVGVDFYASGAPTNYSHALSMTEADIDHHHLRISYANNGLHSYAMKLRDAQFIHCDTAISTEQGLGEIDNVLLYDVTNAFTGINFSAVARNVTVDRCVTLTRDWLNNPSTVAFTNSLLVNVISNGPLAITTNATVFTTNDVFQTVGTAAHYLATNSPYRDAGTTNIPDALRETLRQTTTYPPLLIAGDIASDTTLTIRAWRDTDDVDLGYHYSPLDYAATMLTVTNATLTVSEGVAVAAYGTNGTDNLAHPTWGGRIVTEGSATRLSRLVTHNTVQEGANTNWAQVTLLLYIPWYGEITREVKCSFTEFSAPGGSTAFLRAYDGELHTNALVFKDCQFHSGVFDVSTTWPFAFTNNLFDRMFTYCISGETYYHNNTFFGGAFEFWFPSGAVFDNIFDRVRIAPYENFTNGNNGYGTNVLNFTRIEPISTNDVLRASFTYESGPLSHFYLPTNSPLLDAGSRNATNAGLFHYTSTANPQIKETNSTVNIGAHWVALGTNNVPLDYDGDGVADYREDSNGDGSVNSGETKWQDAADAGLRVFITRPESQSLR
jgi:hypothetical protein